MALVKQALVREERTRARERLLREVGVSLVAARAPEEVYAAALDAIMSLIPVSAAAGAAIWRLQGQAILAVAAAGEAAAHVRGIVLERGHLPDSLEEAITHRALIRIGPQMAGWGPAGPPFPVTRASTLLVPLSAQDDVLGAITISGDLPVPALLEDTLVAIASQLVLALESDELTSDLHRRREEERFGALIANAADVITVVSPDHLILYQTPSIARALGHPPEAVLGKPITGLIHPDDRPAAAAFLDRAAQLNGRTATAEWRVGDERGDWHDVEVVAGNLTGHPQVAGIVLTSRDVSERKALERRLVHQAFHDSLTGLPNRALFRDRAQHALARAGGRGIAVLFIDIDDFKNINDTLGHAAGDQMLSQIADLLHAGLRPGDTAARLGGDEFALLLENVEDPGAAVVAAERLLAELTQPLRVGTREVSVHASIGVAAAAPGDSAEELLRNADIAMYAAKAAGKNCARVFEPEMYVQTLERVELERDLARAVCRDELRLVYQPIVDLEAVRTVGVEALLRWQHPDRGLLRPSEFVELAEEIGAIVPIGRWVLREACRQLQEWRRQDPLARSLLVSINLSAAQLGDPGLIGDVAAALREHEFDPRSLVLEITESAVMEDLGLAIERLDELAALHVQIAIDDFGTGYSSLSYLQRFPFEILKLDRSFTRQLTIDAAEPPLPRAIIELAHTLGLRVIAEGVEEEHQQLQLRELGCNLAQGYRFAHPLAAEQVLAHIVGSASRAL